MTLPLLAHDLPLNDKADIMEEFVGFINKFASVPVLVASIYAALIYRRLDQGPEDLFDSSFVGSY